MVLCACTDNNADHSSKNGTSDTDLTAKGFDMTIDLTHKTDDERFVIAMKTIIQVLTQKISLEQASPILGAGEFIYPKNPKHPVKEYYLRAENVYQARTNGEADVIASSNRINYWNGKFERFNEEMPFYKATLYMSRLKFNKPLLTENLKWKFIKQTTFEKMTTEELLDLYGHDYARNNPEFTRERLMESMDDEYMGYHYTSQENGQTFRYIIYTSKENYNPAEKEFPTKHSKIVVINESQAQMGMQGIEKRSSRVGQPCPATGMWHCAGVSPVEGIYLRKGDPMPGQSYSKEPQETMEWRLIKPLENT